MALRNLTLRRSLAVAIFAGLACSTHALATQAPVPANQAPSVREAGARQTYELALTWISALAVVDEVRLKLGDGNDLTEMMVANRLAKNKLELVRIAFIPLEARYPKPLTEEEKGVRGELTRFVVRLETDIESSFQLMRGVTTVSTEKEVNQLSVELAETVGRLDQTWRALPLMAALLGHALTDSQRLLDGKVAYLRISSEQKTSLQKRVLELFPEAAAPAKDVFAPTVAARLFYSFLSQPWRTSDER